MEEQWEKYLEYAKIHHMFILDKKTCKEIGRKNVANAGKQRETTIVGNIVFDKSHERIQKLVDDSPKADRYYFDDYSAYNEVCYYGTHTSLKNKSQTYTVEGVNSDLRQYIPPLRRKSKCFFRSIDTLKSFLRFLSLTSIILHWPNLFTFLLNLLFLSFLLFKQLVLDTSSLKRLLTI